jgi:hypothetical protein
VTGTGYIGKCISNYKITVVSLYKTPHQKPFSYEATPTKGHPPLIRSLPPKVTSLIRPLPPKVIPLIRSLPPQELDALSIK